VEAHGDVEGFVASVHDNDFPLEAISSLIEEKEKKFKRMRQTNNRDSLGRYGLTLQRK
jgi:hypothetical protein